MANPLDVWLDEKRKMFVVPEEVAKIGGQLAAHGKIAVCDDAEDASRALHEAWASVPSQRHRASPPARMNAGISSGSTDRSTRLIVAVFDARSGPRHRLSG
ncbi:MAG: hypothetical protein IT480_15360 [Gammaproteobacteria bacterium]|nr:hypothetical protein [Gammaproteobacteria bacterium]